MRKREVIFLNNPSGAEDYSRQRASTAVIFINLIVFKMKDLKRLLNFLAEYGGKIISSNDLHADLVAQARAAKRMYVDENGLGYIWEPPFAGRFPMTEKEVKMFEWCYPLEVELPEELKNTDWINRIIEGKKYN